MIHSLPRSVSSERLAEIAHDALCRACRPVGGDVRLVAEELGFSALPVSSEHDAGTCSLTSSTRIVYIREGDAADLDRAVRHALAHGLLLRSALAHGEADVHVLADLLRP